ncbi:MAG: hypothetical protein R6V45_02045 [Oceanipulchritudo sp.]
MRGKKRSDVRLGEIRFTRALQSACPGTRPDMHNARYTDPEID